MSYNNKFDRYNTGDYEWNSKFWDNPLVKKEELVEFAKTEDFNYNNFDEIASVDAVENLSNRVNDNDFKFDSLPNNDYLNNNDTPENIDFSKIKVKTKFNR